MTGFREIVASGRLVIAPICEARVSTVLTHLEAGSLFELVGQTLLIGSSGWALKYTREAHQPESELSFRRAGRDGTDLV